jgi:predicted AAA+ superfamily ATPase
MFRKIYKDIESWKNMHSNTALLVTGARQVGKTHIIREFTKNNYKHFCEINFLKTCLCHIICIISIWITSLNI